jgi:hypothetical protein
VGPSLVELVGVNATHVVGLEDLGIEHVGMLVGKGEGPADAGPSPIERRSGLTGRP